VTLVETGEQATVLDVGLAQLPARRDWQVDKVFVRRGRGGRSATLRRRGETLTVEWSAVTGFALEESDQGAANLLATFEQLRAPDLANVLHHLSAKRRAEVAAALDDDRLADVLEELPEDDQVEILGKLKDERAADVLEAMDPDAGGMMTTEPIILRPDATVAEALARVRNADLSAPLAAQVYVVRPPDETPTGTYLGVVHFQRLLRDPPFTLVGSIVDSDLRPLPPDTRLSALTSYLATYNIVAAPVVDEGEHLLGAVTVDDVLDHLLPSDWRASPAAGLPDLTGDGESDDALSEDVRGAFDG
jgi:CBS domain-containing protein